MCRCLFTMWLRMGGILGGGEGAGRPLHREAVGVMQEAGG